MPVSRNDIFDELHIERMPVFFFIGMMGSGKTYWSDILADEFDFGSYDLDALIEMAEQKTITEIFAEHGEKYFRELEREALHSTEYFINSIIATGGGTPCFFDNMKWMNKTGITVWIDEGIDTLVMRLKKEKSKRPLIKDLGNDELKSFLEKKHEERKPFYQQAQYHLQGKDISLETFKKIIQQHV